MEGLQLMTNGTQRQKLRFLFDVYDVDGRWTGFKEMIGTGYKCLTIIECEVKEICM